MREFICKGWGKEYVIKATNSIQAQQKAASRYREETGRVEPIQFLALLFTTHVKEPKPMGRPSILRQIYGDRIGKDER